MLGYEIELNFVNLMLISLFGVLKEMDRFIEKNE